MPPCPIKGGHIAKTIPVTLPNKSPVPVAITVTGSVTAKDSSGQNLLGIDVNVGVSP